MMGRSLHIIYDYRIFYRRREAGYGFNLIRGFVLGREDESKLLQMETSSRQ